MFAGLCVCVCACAHACVCRHSCSHTKGLLSTNKELESEATGDTKRSLRLHSPHSGQVKGHHGSVCVCVVRLQHPHPLIVMATVKQLSQDQQSKFTASSSADMVMKHAVLIMCDCMYVCVRAHKTRKPVADRTI